jgi:hypothetical protein
MASDTIGAMNPYAALAALLVLSAACTTTQRDASAREWARSECNRVLDTADRERCLKRVDEEYGSGQAERRPPPSRRY